MTSMGRAVPLALAAAGLWTASSAAETLTVDRAVQMALANNAQVVQAEASVLDARGGLYTSYSQMLPRLSADFSRSLYKEDHRSGSRAFAGFVVPGNTQDLEQYSSSPSVSASWTVLNLSSLTGLSSSRLGLKAAQLSRRAARQDVALDARRKYYEVVKAVQLAGVSSDALRLSRDNEHRVRALFEVGSVSRSDVLKAQVRTAQSELDSLGKHNQISQQRINLSTALGIDEGQLSDVDTVITFTAQDYDEGAVLAEAQKSRPDLMAAEAELKAARAGLRAANFARLPYLSVSGSADLNPKSSFTTTTFDTVGVKLPKPIESSGRSELHRDYRADISITWNPFNGLATESGIAHARARLLRAQDSFGLLQRNLAGEVRQTLLTYREVVVGYNVAQRAIDSATENLKLTQQKYSVGSATILELIDAQVQLQQARSDGVSALAAIRVGEAQVDRVRGHAE
jgi:outer membrane protein